MKKQILLLSIIFLASVMAYAQTNPLILAPPPSGGHLIVPSGAYIHISGAPSIVLDNTSLTNNGDYTSAAEEVLFTGDVAQTISGTSNTGVYNLTVNNTGGVTSQLGLLTANDLTIGSGSTFNIDPAKNVTVNGNFINAGTFNIESDDNGTGSFINNGSISGSGTFNVNKYLAESRWWYLGSPISDAKAEDFGSLSNTANNGIRLFWYDEPYGDYRNVTIATEAVPTLRGYAYKNFNIPVIGPQTLVFTGDLNTGIIGTPGNLSLTATGSYDGYNLVCNPYPSAIDIEVFGPASTNIENTIWYRTEATYPTYNWVSDIGQLGGQPLIPAMQAFWVRAISNPGTLIFDNSSRKHDSHAFYKDASEDNVFRIEALSGNYKDEAVIHFNSNAQDAFENYDSRKMFVTDNDEVPQIFTSSADNILLAINGLPELVASEERIVPLGFVANTSGNFTLDATNLDQFDNDISVYLEDLFTSSMQDLRTNNVYSFSSGIVNNSDRFLLHFGSITTGTPSVPQSAINAYAYDQTIYVNTPEAGASIEIYDLLGNLVATKKSISGMNMLQLDLSNGVYMVRVQNGNSMRSDKVIIK